MPFGNNWFSFGKRDESSATRYSVGERSGSDDPSRVAMESHQEADDAQPLLIDHDSVGDVNYPNGLASPGVEAVSSREADILVIPERTEQPAPVVLLADRESDEPDELLNEKGPVIENKADGTKQAAAAASANPGSPLQRRPPSSFDKYDKERRISNLKQQLRSRIAKDMGKDPEEVMMVGVIGSVECMNKFWTKDLCDAIGKSLAREAGANVAIVTGGMYGVGELCAKAFADKRHEMGLDEHTYMVLPVADPDMAKYEKKAPVEKVSGELRFKEWGFGTTIFLGESVEEREELMAEIPVMIMLEGGPGAQREARLAIEGNRSVIPIAVTGGAAGNLLGEEKVNFHLPDVLVGNEDCQDAWNAVCDREGHAGYGVGEEEKKKLRIEKISSSASKLVKIYYKETVLIQGQVLKSMIAKEMGKDPGDVILVGVIGSVSFYNKKWSPMLCQAIGQELALAAGESIALVTGGMYGVGEHVARSFAETRKANRNQENTYMILPESEADMETYKDKAPTEQDAEGNWIFREWEFGKTIFIGESIKDREKLLTTVTPVLIMLEGGPNAKEEATMAVKNGHLVIPIAISGGGAAALKDQVEKPVQDLICSMKQNQRSKLEASWEAVRKVDHNEPDPETVTAIARAMSSLVIAKQSLLLAKTHKKPSAVISYNIAQTQFKERVEYILKSLGFDLDPPRGYDLSPGIDEGRFHTRTREWLDKASAPETKVIVFIISTAYVKSPAYQNEFQFIMNDRMASIALPIMYGEIEHPPPNLDFFLSQVQSIQVEVTRVATPEIIPSSEMRKMGKPDSWEGLLKLSAMLTSERVFSFYDEAESMEQQRAITPGDMSEPEQETEEGQSSQLEALLKEHLLLEISKDMQQTRESILLVGISGSVDFYNPFWSEEICEEIGRELAEIAGENVALVTGGFKGVGECIARAFAETRVKNKQQPHTYMVLPWGEKDTKFQNNGPGVEELGSGKWRFKEWDFGKTIFVGETVKQRERVLGICPVIIVVEGGPGARAEATLAIQDKRHVIPIAVTGGAAGDGTVAFRFPEEIARSDHGEYSQLAEAWDVIMDKHGTNGEGLRTKSQRTVKKQRIVKIAQSAGLLVSTILKHTIDQSEQSLVHGEEKSVKSIATGQGMIQHRPKNLVNICTRPLKAAAHHHHGTSSKKITDNERRLLQYLEDLPMNNSEQGSNENGTTEHVPLYILNGHRGNMKYADKEWEEEIDKMAEELDQLHGEFTGKDGAVIKKWLCVYPGDPYIPDESDVAHVAARLRARGVRFLALLPDVKKDEVLEPRQCGTYKHLEGGGVYFHPTEWVQDLSPDTNGKASSKEMRILTGGRHPQNGSLCGVSKLYFDLLFEHIQGQILVGGGAVSRDDYRECIKLGIPVHYVRARVAVKANAETNSMWHATAKLPTGRLELHEVYGEFGVMDSCHEFYQKMLTSNQMRPAMTAKSLVVPAAGNSEPKQAAAQMQVRSFREGRDSGKSPSAKFHAGLRQSMKKGRRNQVQGLSVKKGKRNQVHPETVNRSLPPEAWGQAPPTNAGNTIIQRFMAMHPSPGESAAVTFPKPGGIAPGEKLLVEGTVKFMAQGTNQGIDDKKKGITTVSTKGVVQVWDLQTREEQCEGRLDLLLMLPEYRSARPTITAVRIFELLTMEHVVIGCDDGNVYLWDMNRLKEAEKARNHANSEVQRMWRKVGQPKTFTHPAVQEGRDPQPIETLVVQGERLVTGDSTRQIWIWDIRMPEAPFASFTRPTPVKCLFLSRGRRENHLLFTGCEDGSLHVYDVISERERGLLSSQETEQSQLRIAHAGGLSAMCATSDGELLITGGSDKFIRLWSIETGKVLREIRLPDERSDKPGLQLPVSVNALCVMPNDLRLAVGFTIGRGAGAQGAVFVYDLGALSCKQFLAIELTAGKYVNPGVVNLLQPSVDGRALFSTHHRIVASKGKNSFDSIWRWDIDPCYEVMSLKGSFSALGVTRDGMVVTSSQEAQECRLHILDVQARTSRSVDSANQKAISCIALCELGSTCLVFTGSQDGKIGVWDMLNDGEVELLGTKDVGSTIESISVDPLGDRLYFASGSDLWVLPTNSMGGELSRRWKDACSDSKPVSERAKDHNSSRKLDAARKKICCLCACPCSIPDKRIVVSGSEDGKLEMWLHQPQKSAVMTSVASLEGHTQRVNSVDFSSDGMRIVSCSDDRTIRIWDAQARTEIAQIVARSGMGVIHSVRFGKNGEWVVSGSESPDWNGPTCCVWDVSTGSLVAAFDAEQELCSNVALVPNKSQGRGCWQIAAICKQDNEVCVYEIDEQPDTLNMAPKSETEQKQDLLKLMPDQTLVQWGLSFTFFAQAKSQLKGGEKSVVPSTLRVSKGNAETTFFLPLPAGEYAVELRLESREGIGEDIFVMVQRSKRNESDGEGKEKEKDGPEKEKDGLEEGCVYQSWLLDLPRGQRFLMLRSPFELPPLHLNSAVMAADGRAGCKSLLHRLASASSTERVQLMKECDKYLPQGFQGISGLLASCPSLKGLLWAQDSNGKIPLELLLEQAAAPDGRFFMDLMQGYKDAAADCTSSCDLKGLTRIMGCCAKLMPLMAHNNLNLDKLWEIFDHHGALILDTIDCPGMGRYPFSAKVFYAPPKASEGTEKAGDNSKLMVVTVPGLFDKYRNELFPDDSAKVSKSDGGRDKKLPETPWNFFVGKVPDSRFSMPLIRVAVNFRQREGGLKLIKFLLVNHLLILISCCFLLYSHKWKQLRLADGVDMSPNTEIRDIEPSMSLTTGEIVVLSYLCFEAAVLLVQEARQMHDDFKDNLQDPWTYVDISLGVCIYGLTWALFDAAEWFSCWLSFCLVLCWFKLIGFMRSQESTASIVRMIMQVASKTRIYVGVLAMLVVGFSMANHALVPSFIHGSGLWDWHVMLLRQVRFTLADFGIFEYEMNRDKNKAAAEVKDDIELSGLYMEDFPVFRGSYINYLALLTINLAFIYLVSIILLNLLISVISEIYEQVKEDELVALTQYRARLDLELFDLYIMPYRAMVTWLRKLNWLPAADRSSTAMSEDSSLLLFVTLPEGEAETWVPSTEGQAEGLRPMFRRIRDVKDSITGHLDKDVTMLKGEVDSVRSEMIHLKDDTEAILRKIAGARNSRFQGQEAEAKDLESPQGEERAQHSRQAVGSNSDSDAGMVKGEFDSSRRELTELKDMTDAIAPTTVGARGSESKGLDTGAKDLLMPPAEAIPESAQSVKQETPPPKVLPHTYRYPRPALTVDAVIVAEEAAVPQLLLIQRKIEPFKDYWALPGGFVNEDESLDTAAERELEEETSVSPKDVNLVQVGTFGDEDRDPRGWTVTVAYACVVPTTKLGVKAADDAKNAQWYSINELPELAFDHKKVVKTSFERLAKTSSGTIVELLEKAAAAML